MSSRDTIFALTTPRGRSGVAVIRVSGSEAFDVAEEMCGALGPPRTANLRTIVDPSSKRKLDEGLVLHFLEDESFTGERVVEFQVHGSLAVIDAVTETLSSYKGLRLAQPGEFTKRAMLNNRMDLSQVEGLSDLIEAETEAQHEQSLLIMQGELGQKTDRWRSKILKIMGKLEASIDFDDEEIPDNVLDDIQSQIDDILVDLRAEQSGADAARLIREGFTVAIVGKPNAGKSTLLNALAGKEAAITSELAGTTRDVIEVRMNIDGYSVTLLDTAGLRERTDGVERIGIELAKRRSQEADLRIVLSERHEDVKGLPVEILDDDIVVASKADLHARDFGLRVSTKTGEGLEVLLDRVKDVLSRRLVGASSLVRQRHAIALGSAIENLESAMASIGTESFDAEIVAEMIRESVRSLDVLVGKVDVEHVLGEIFSNFCIGK